jgi:hypothetical protein
VRLRYVIRVTITRGYNGSFSKEQDILVQNISAVRKSSNRSKIPILQDDTYSIIIMECMVLVWLFDVYIVDYSGPSQRRVTGGCPFEDGSGYRRLPTHRVRIRQAEISPQGTV